MFSIILLSWNSGSSLPRSLRSIQAQLYPSYEIVVVERGEFLKPGEQTLALAERFGRKVRFIHAPNASLAAAQRQGLHWSSGEHVLFLDARDELMPLALELHGGYFRRYPTNPISYGRTVLRGRDGIFQPSEDGMKPQGDLFEILFREKFHIHLSSMVCRRDVLEAAIASSPAPDEFEQSRLVLDLARKHRFGCVQEDVVIVEKPEPLSPASLSRYCRFMQQWVKRCADRLPAQEVADQLAVWECQAAQEWIRVGYPYRALAHLRRASRLVPRRVQYWLLQSAVRTRLLFHRPISLPRRAA